MEARQETTEEYPEDRKDSRTTATAVMNQFSDSTIAGDTRHTVNEPTNPERSSAAVVTGQGLVTRQPRSEFNLVEKGPDKGDPEKGEKTVQGYNGAQRGPVTRVALS